MVPTMMPIIAWAIGRRKISRAIGISRAEIAQNAHHSSCSASCRSSLGCEGAMGLLACGVPKLAVPGVRN